MNDRTRQIVLQAVGMGLALGVGILIGERACTPEPEVVEKEVEGSTRIVERCPDAGTPDAGRDAGPPPEPPPSKETRDRPEDDGPDPSRQRRELLRWAQDHADGLIGCRRGASELEAVIVTLHLDEKARIEEVDVAAPEDEDAPGRALSCIDERIAQWEPPADLVADRKEIVFRLDL